LVGNYLPYYICAINQTLKHKAMTHTIETTALRNKTIVLAKTCQFGLNAVSYMNDKQASKKAMDLKAAGIECSVYQAWGSNVRYIKIH
jgi:hypothetical protein